MKTLYTAIIILAIGAGLFFIGRALEHFPKIEIERGFACTTEAK